MAKITLPTVTSGYTSATAINNAFDAIEAELQNKVLYRDNPSGEPNQFENDVDLNNYSLLNADTVDTDNLIVGGTNLNSQVTNAAASAAAAAVSATNASTSATNSATSATASANSATASANSASASASSAASAAASYDSFDDRYLGVKATAPTVDNDGDALVTGAIYWNSTDTTFYVWNGSAWVVTTDNASSIAAAASATAAASSATDAQTAQTAAETAQTAAETAQTGAETAETNATTQATNAATSATNAASSATSAASSATTATTKATEASTSATAAASSASAASTSATNAATSASSAATSATQAAASETTVATSATNAANSATAAASSATSAASSASAASASATTAANRLDDFDDIYLGPKASAPALDNDGDPLQTGALYWNTVTDQLNAWDGSAWQQAAFSASGTVVSFNGRDGAVNLTTLDVTNALGGAPMTASLNLSDLTNVATARSNLGVTATGQDTTYNFRANNLSDVADAGTARTNLGLGTVATQASNNVNITGGTLDGVTITGLSDPTNAGDAATKNYVDNAVTGLVWKDAANLLADSNISLTGTTGTLVIDGHAALVTADAGYRLLLTGQTTDSENGIYVYGDDGANYTLSRATDGDVYTELQGASIFILEGTSYANTGWVQENYETTDFTGQSWIQFSGAGAYTATDGIQVSGNEFSLTNTGVTANTYGSASTSLTATIDAKGRITSITSNPIAITNTQITGLGALATLNSVGSAQIDTGAVTSDEIASDAVGADELKVTGNGTSGQALTSDGDGTFSWTTISVDPTMGGDLSGTASNAQIVAGAVGTTELATDAVTNAKVANDAIGIAELSATGTPSSSTYLRGDNTWAAVSGGVTSGDQYFNTAYNCQAQATGNDVRAAGYVFLSSNLPGGSTNLGVVNTNTSFQLGIMTYINNCNAQPIGRYHGLETFVNGSTLYTRAHTRYNNCAANCVCNC